MLFAIDRRLEIGREEAHRGGEIEDRVEARGLHGLGRSGIAVAKEKVGRTVVTIKGADLENRCVGPGLGEDR